VTCTAALQAIHFLHPHAHPSPLSLPLSPSADLVTW
jgi:hypothetical protein